MFKVFAGVPSGEFSGKWFIFATKESDTCGLPAGFLSDTLVVEQNDSQLMASASYKTLRYAEEALNCLEGVSLKDTINPLLE